MSKTRCLVINAEAVTNAFLGAIDVSTRINKETLINRICKRLNLTPGEIKSIYQDAFLHSNMLGLGWIYDDMTETYYKLYENFNEAANQVLIGLDRAGYSKSAIDRVKVIINNIFGGVIHGSNVDPSELSLSNKDKGIRLLIKKEDLR